MSFFVIRVFQLFLDLIARGRELLTFVVERPRSTARRRGQTGGAGLRVA